MNKKKARQLRKYFLKEGSRLVTGFRGNVRWEGGMRKYRDEKKAYNRDTAVRDRWEVVPGV